MKKTFSFKYVENAGLLKKYPVPIINIVNLHFVKDDSQGEVSLFKYLGYTIL